MSSLWWLLVPGAATLYCAIRAALDFRRKRYALAAIGALLTVGLLCMPFPTHSVKIEIPR